MTSLLNNRQARRRGITFTILIAITLLLMAFSANPYVQDLQSGLSFALRPFQGAIAGVADSVAGVAGAVGEIDSLRTENGTLRDENEQLRNENARLEAVRAENEQLTALVQLQSGLDHKTVATRVIGRETLETRRVVILDKGTDDGIAEGDVVIVGGGALAGRVTVAGPTFSKVTLISDSTSTVVGQLAESGKSGEVVGQAGGVLIMRNIDSAVPIGVDEEVFTAGIEVNAGMRSPYPKGLVIGSVVDVQRDANDVVQTAFLAPAADLDSFELALVITDYQGGLPPGDEVPVPCGTDGTVPEGEVVCYTPAPKPAATVKP
ncbi:MAG TPA: rod shape-determining protein MreC [Candidatus Limnocylindrales bacterium]|nr:rod shape-determining protein MreC [Candidatus Limnocylindrales bacterium]